MMRTELTDEQRDIAASGADAHLLVTAGPGTGKTHTLVARISQLVETEDVPPGSILALSFSRAAVGELRRRLRATGEDAGRVRPITFDSFATRMLNEIEPDGSWTDETFDGRIAKADEKVPEMAKFLSDIEHVCIDEVQDLVGVRMKFVRNLLDTMDVGFTLLGDPAQGIYDFSLGDDEDPVEVGSPAFYSWVRWRYRDELRDVSLTINHRAKTDITRDAAGLGPIVIDNPVEAGKQLTAVLAEAPRMGNLSLLRNVPANERTAILCRDNGDALWVSRHLQADGIDHVLQRGATNRTIAPWVASVVMATGGGVLSRERFDRALEAVAGEPPYSDDVWLPLRRVACSDSGGVDFDLLVRRMREGIIPDELHTTRSAPIVVSTVHRAKGLEFDRVVILDHAWSAPFEDEDAKTLFVAMTRAIETLATADLPGLSGQLRKDSWTDRWVHTGWQRWKRFGMEVTPADVDTLEPAGHAHLTSDAGEIQRMLAEEVRPGDPVTIEFVRRLADLRGAIYRVMWHDKPIGLTSQRFNEQLVDVVKTFKHWKHPKRIDGLTIDAVRSVAGDPSITLQDGLGPGGAWLAPSLVGMANFVWETPND